MVEFCLVTHRIGAYIEDSDTDLDRKPDHMVVNGQVRLTPKLAKGDAVLVTDDEGARTVPVVPITAQIINGVLTHEGEPGVYVFAGGPNSNPETLAYTVEYSNLTAGSHKLTLRSTSFEAVPGGEVDLAGLTPVAGTTGAGVTRGDPGLTPYIGQGGTWWIGSTNTGVTADPSAAVTAAIGDRLAIFPVGAVETPADSGIYTLGGEHVSLIESPENPGTYQIGII